jgi:hypothetical protein
LKKKPEKEARCLGQRDGVHTPYSIEKRLGVHDFFFLFKGGCHVVMSSVLLFFFIFKNKEDVLFADPNFSFKSGG